MQKPGGEECVMRGWHGGGYRYTYFHEGGASIELHARWFLSCNYIGLVHLVQCLIWLCFTVCAAAVPLDEAQATGEMAVRLAGSSVINNINQTGDLASPDRKAHIAGFLRSGEWQSGTRRVEQMPEQSPVESDTLRELSPIKLNDTLPRTPQPYESYHPSNDSSNPWSPVRNSQVKQSEVHVPQSKQLVPASPSMSPDPLSRQWQRLFGTPGQVSVEQPPSDLDASIKSEIVGAVHTMREVDPEEAEMALDMAKRFYGNNATPRKELDSTKEQEALHSMRGVLTS